MTEITANEKRRAENIIWNCAGSYSFTPDFKAFRSDGTADLYWNCIIGAVRRHYEYPKLEAVLRSFQQYGEGDTYEGLLWLGLENCVFRRESKGRPVLERLRAEYAAAFIAEYSAGGKGIDDCMLYDSLALAHWMRVSGREPALSKYDIRLLDALEFSPEMTTDEIVAAAKDLFSRWFQITAEERKKSRRPVFRGFRRRGEKDGGRLYRRFGIGIVHHPQNIYGGASSGGVKDEASLASRMTEAELRSFMEGKFGRSAFPAGRALELERALCCGGHETCHLLFTAGDRPPASEIKNGFEALSRQREAAQVEANRSFYYSNLVRNTLAASRLSESIRNSVLMHMRPSPVRSGAGALNAGKVWRAAYLGDGKVFTRPENDGAGDLCVDILLDASTSQKSRQETVSSQARIIAESLTRCAIPCRVMSFCSMTGYTVLRVFRDYASPGDNDRIFEYVANGCNRDGLAVKAAARLISEAPYEHKILIILSDVKPNDVVRIRSSVTGEPVPYEKQAGLGNTAVEVRRARAEGIAVICIFTGDDDDLPSAKTVYGGDFVRIRSFDMLADTVGRLIQNRIKNL